MNNIEHDIREIIKKKFTIIQDERHLETVIRKVGGVNVKEGNLADEFMFWIKPRNIFVWVRVFYEYDEVDETNFDNAELYFDYYNSYGGEICKWKRSVKRGKR